MLTSHTLLHKKKDKNNKTPPSVSPKIFQSDVISKQYKIKIVIYTNLYNISLTYKFIDLKYLQSLDSKRNSSYSENAQWNQLKYYSICESNLILCYMYYGTLVPLGHGYLTKFHKD